MEDEKTYTVGELADAAGVSRRAVRFYVQRGLLQPPEGKGRGSQYEQKHLDRLLRIQSLQASGHSLEAIARLLETGDQNERPASHDTISNTHRKQVRSAVQAELWTRLTLAEGVEVHIDTARHNPTVEQLKAIKKAIQEVLAGPAV